jgi:hypothetical protein
MRALFSRTPLNLRRATIKTLISHFKYPRLGPGQMWEACRDRAPHPCAEGVAPQPVRKAAEELRSRDFLLVALILNREGLFPDNWLYIHTPRFKVGRVQNYNNWSPALVPMPNRTCLGMEYFCSRGDELWSRDDRELVDLASRELSDLGLAPGASVVDAAVVRAQDAYPVYDSTYREHLHSLRLFLDPIANLHTVGRNGMYKYNNQDHSMYAAMLTVANLRGESHDVWEVNTDLEYHEAQKVCATNAARGLKPQPARGSLDTQPHFPPTQAVTERLRAGTPA